MNLINRDLLIAKIRDDGILGNGYSDSEREDDVIDMIESCETIDAVHVVRCKDCKFADTDVTGLYCTGYHKYVNVQPDDYCSYGERGETRNADDD